MKKIIYILSHREKGFTGFVHGVGFENGRGSTVSKRDRDYLVKKLKFKDITQQYWAAQAKKKAAEEKKKKKVEKKEAGSEEKAEAGKEG